MSQRLADKITVITGATSGIGEATARHFIGQGASVVLAGRSADKGEQLAEELGTRARFKRTDVTHETEVAALVDFAVAEFGRLDVLFNNAGAGDRSTCESFDQAELERSMRLLVGAPAFGIKHGARVMKARGGCIINNTSIAAYRRQQGGYLYSTAKAAVVHMTRLAGVELGEFGIRVNAISPGGVATPIFWGGSERAQHLSDEENRRKMDKLKTNLARAAPLPRAGLPEDIAAAAAFLASDDGSFINCHDLVVDGGRIAMFNEKPGG